MAPPPRLGTLIDDVERDAGTGDEIDQLATASDTATRLGELGDALLDHFVDRCRRSGHSWADISAVLGVSRQAAHKRFSASVEPERFGRFTPRAKAVVTAAGDRARSMHHGYVGTEHLLLGLYDQPEGLAAKILVELGAPEARATEVVTRLAPPGDTETAPAAPIPHTSRAVDALKMTLTDALQLGHNYIGTEHILLALSEGDDESMAVRALRECGVTGDAVRAAVVRKIAEFVADLGARQDP